MLFCLRLEFKGNYFHYLDDFLFKFLKTALNVLISASSYEYYKIYCETFFTDNYMYFNNTDGCLFL